MPIPGSATYKSVNPTETIRPKETYPSGVPPDAIHGPDWTVPDPRALLEHLIETRDIPVAVSLEPDTLTIADPDTEIIVTGANFNAESIIVWNEGDEVTTFIDSEHLSTVAKPSTVEAPELPFSLPVAVRNGERLSNELTFTFTESPPIP
jgi:IPT/TIG domain